MLLLHISALTTLSVSKTDSVDSRLFPAGAPYKPLVLFSLFDAIGCREVNTPMVRVTPILINRFDTYIKLVDDRLKGGVVTPFVAMNHEAFWKIQMKPGYDFDTEYKSLRSLVRYHECVDFAVLTDDFWEKCQRTELRGVFRYELMKKYFNETLHTRLWEYSFLQDK